MSQNDVNSEFNESIQNESEAKRGSLTSGEPSPEIGKRIANFKYDDICAFFEKEKTNVAKAVFVLKDGSKHIFDLADNSFGVYVFEIEKTPHKPMKLSQEEIEKFITGAENKNVFKHKTQKNDARIKPVVENNND